MKQTEHAYTCGHQTKLFTIRGLPTLVTFFVTGKFRPATQTDPAEYPQFTIVSTNPPVPNSLKDELLGLVIRDYQSHIEVN